MHLMLVKYKDKLYFGSIQFKKIQILLNEDG